MVWKKSDLPELIAQCAAGDLEAEYELAWLQYSGGWVIDMGFYPQDKIKGLERLTALATRGNLSAQQSLADIAANTVRLATAVEVEAERCRGRDLASSANALKRRLAEEDAPLIQELEQAARSLMAKSRSVPSAIPAADGEGASEPRLMALCKSDGYFARGDEAPQEPKPPPPVDPRKLRLFAYLFARPSSPFAQSQIFNDLIYMVERSKYVMQIHVAGLGQFSTSELSDPKEFAARLLAFDAVSFENTRREIASKTAWIYSGECDLLICNAAYDPDQARATAHWNPVVACHLNSLIEVNAFSSVAALFERIVFHAEHCSETDPIWDLSDRLGLDRSMSILWRFLLLLLPKRLRQEVKTLSSFAVLDVTSLAGGQLQRLAITS